MNLASYIDHTILKAQATPKDIEKLCQEAIKHKFAAACVNPCYVAYAASLLKDSDVRLATVVGFPLGASTIAVKVREVEDAIKNGATEIDMVMAIGYFLAGAHKRVQEEIKEIMRVALKNPVKVIIETCYLSNEEIYKAANIVAGAGAAFVKTSTGFGTRGASVEDIKIIKSAVGSLCKIKASGGIKTREQALLMIENGASRIGTSSGVEIVGE